MHIHGVKKCLAFLCSHIETILIFDKTECSNGWCFGVFRTFLITLNVLISLDVIFHINFYTGNEQIQAKLASFCLAFSLSEKASKKKKDIRVKIFYLNQLISKRL